MKNSISMGKMDENYYEYETVLFIERGETFLCFYTTPV